MKEMRGNDREGQEDIGRNWEDTQHREAAKKQSHTMKQACETAVKTRNAAADLPLQRYL